MSLTAPKIAPRTPPHLYSNTASSTSISTPPVSSSVSAVAIANAAAATNSSSSTTTFGNYQVPILAVVFASSGAALNLLQQQLYYAGAGNGSLLILIVPTFLGMIVGGFGSANTRQELNLCTSNNTFSTTTILDYDDDDNDKKSKSSSSSTTFFFHNSILLSRMRQIIWVSLTDVTSLTLRSLSQNLCGSGMFTVIYASLPAFNGILSYFFLGRILTLKQWISMAIVIIGLMCSAQAEEDSLQQEQEQKNAAAIHQVATGILLGLAGTFFSSASYVCAERVLKSPNAPRYPTTLTAINGMNDLFLTTPWLLGYSIPHRQDLLYEPVAEKGFSPFYLVILWLCLIASNAAHLNACYMLLQITESVTLTMLQGVRAVMVFAISGALFCSASSPEQCLSIQKVICSFVVLFGVVMYAKSTAGLSKHMGSTSNVGDDGSSSSFGNEEDTTSGNINYTAAATATSEGNDLILNNGDEEQQLLQRKSVVRSNSLNNPPTTGSSLTGSTTAIRRSPASGHRYTTSVTSLSSTTILPGGGGADELP